jgi:spore maturation protein B
VLSLIPALLLAGLCVYGQLLGVDLYETLTDGAAKGLQLIGQLLPGMVVLFSGIWLLRASGLPEALTGLLAPLLRLLGIPPETALLLLIRPLSGSAAMAAASELMAKSGVDSYVGRCAAVMLGSSETTFYVLGLYYGAAGKKPARWVIPAALCADLACFVSSAWLCRVM